MFLEMFSTVQFYPPSVFHRAILMSGSALSDWAFASHSVNVTSNVAIRLKCPLSEDELNDCLRSKNLSDIKDAALRLGSKYETTFGPTVDGVVIMEHPKEMTESDNREFYSK